MSVSRSVWRASMATMKRLASSSSAWMRSGRDSPSMVSAGPWQTSACQSAPGLAASQRSRVFWPPPSRIGHAVEAVLDVEPAHRGRRDRARREPAVGDERPQDERHRRRAVLLADVEQELPLLGGELLGVAAVAARRGPQGGEAAGPVGVVPALERRRPSSCRVSLTPGGRKRSSESARKAARSSPWSSSLRVSAPTISLRKMATASAWSFGASGVALGDRRRRRRGGLVHRLAPRHRPRRDGGVRRRACPAAGASAEGSSMVGSPPPRRRGDGPQLTCAPRGTPPTRWRALRSRARRPRASSPRGPPPGAGVASAGSARTTGKSRPARTARAPPPQARPARRGGRARRSGAGSPARRTSAGASRSATP